MEPPQKLGWRRRPVVFHGLIAFALSLLLAIALWKLLGLSWRWMPWLGAWLFAVNLTTFAYYGFDKFQARREGAGRIPEIVLHALALTGGSVGAVLGMRLFRHKTVKPGFRLVFWLIVLTHLALMIGIAYRMWLR